ncbi:hypothetical protein D0869_11140 [Hortaea werneckii]|uniref:BTB domain-containing protein n=1 Tax=Hortaea werneckii TaxID=91943 RepID=A0A3M6WBN3_HORWE|nr:hypothetical protein D0869_11140 [Hortaea werneckii]RMX96774.1 hypothetical protein D0868_11002 [Hortaea werneckii]
MEEVKAFASNFSEQNLATVIIDAQYTYKMPPSLLDKLWPRCPKFCEDLTLEVDKNGSFEHSTYTGFCHAFELFLFWAAEERLPYLEVPDDDITEVEISTADLGGDNIVEILADLWAFAADYSISKLQNEAMKNLLEVLSKVIVGPETLKLFYCLNDRSQLKTVLLLEVAHGLCCGFYETEDEDTLAKLNGFLTKFAGLVRGEGLLDPKETSPSRVFVRGDDISAFLVPEE